MGIGYEYTFSNPDYSKLPYKIYVKKHTDGVNREYAGKNPIINNGPFNPILLNNNDKLTIVYGDYTNSYIKQLEGTDWIYFPTDEPIAQNIIRQGKFLPLDVHSAFSADGKIYYAWRKRGADHTEDYFCGYVDEIVDM